ncbi:hypothetical protein [Paracoccus ravus]|uniref:hypothetical protein n=1 Tax=Paracoccus ravus TaxID=2447760 RepID=UPI00106F0423|nr:hypothetical protein [Paracoccus ravus]
MRDRDFPAAKENFDISDDPAPLLVPTGPAPQWLLDLRSAPGRGFYQSLGEHALVFADRDSDTLLVSFDNLSSARDGATDRNPWGYEFVAKNGWSQLGVLAFGATWYRDEALFTAMRRLASDGFFARFRHVVLTGTSMGGYAACAFAELVPGCTVLAFSPQSTLRKDLVPWEPRFSIGRKADWSGDFADAAASARAAGSLWLIHDPCFRPDLLHAGRFVGPHVHLLPARYSGHKSALFLRRAGILSAVTRLAVAGELTPQAFAALYRKGRSLPWYLDALAEDLIEKRKAGLLARLIAICARNGNAVLARRLTARAGRAGLTVRARPASRAPARHALIGAESASRPLPLPPGPVPIWTRLREPLPAGGFSGLLS